MVAVSPDAGAAAAAAVIDWHWKLMVK